MLIFIMLSSEDFKLVANYNHDSQRVWTAAIGISNLPKESMFLIEEYITNILPVIYYVIRRIHSLHNTKAMKYSHNKSDFVGI